MVYNKNNEGWMKKNKLVLIICILLFTTSTTKAPPYFCSIWIENISSKNIFCEIYYLNEKKEEITNYFCKICVERTESLFYYNLNSYDQSECDPNNFFTRIFLYDMDTGEVLTSINVKSDTFFHESGDLEYKKGNPALFKLLIVDELFQENDI